MRIVAPVLALLLAAPAALASQNVLTIPGAAPTLLATAAGGTGAGVVVEEALGASPFTRKHLGNVKYEAIELSFAPQQCSPLFGFIDATLAANYQRKDGEVLTADASGKVLRRIRFYLALVSSVTLPATGAQGDEAALGVTLAPEFTRLDFPGGRVALPAVQSPPVPLRTVLSLAGLPAVDVRTEPITIAVELNEDAIGEGRDYEREPGKLEIPNLKLTIPEDALVSFFAWYQDFVVNGNNAQESEKTGSLSYFTANRPLVHLDLAGVGISSLRPAAGGGWEVVLYAEEAGISSDTPCANP